MSDPLIVNLGCGEKVAAACLNIDYHPLLRLKRGPLPRWLYAPLLGDGRRARLAAIPDQVVCHDLLRGIPLADGSADAVYHSHLVEHLERWEARRLLVEVHRVLKPGGIQRIAVPDLEGKARRYLQHLILCDGDPAERERHDRFVASLIEQSLRQEAASARRHGGLRRWAENLLLGGARRRRETHRWMYDRANLGHLLAVTGFVDIAVRRWNESAISDWPAIGLEIDGRGGEHKPGSLYIEARRPAP
ncbi:class I SAM-dependent methyltransferase [Endothiovibrio diazotrophicus]